MAVNSMYSINQTFRFTGLASGLDTESIVDSLMQIEQMKVDKLKQEKQLLEWRRDDYREITNLLRGFYDKYFDILYAETNMRSPNAYNTYVAKSSKEEYLTVEANADAIKKDYQITNISVATAAYSQSTGRVSKDIQGAVTVSDTSGTIELADSSLLITLDGVTKQIKFERNYLPSEFGQEFQNLLDEAFGEGRINVTFDTDSNNLSLIPGSSASTMTIAGGDALDSDQGALAGFKIGQSNKINLDSTLLGLQDQFVTELKFDDENQVSFKINGKEFTFSGNKTLRQVISEINASNAGVTLYYSSITDTFRLENKATGAAQGLTFENLDGTNFLAALGLETIEPGKDAELTIKNGESNITITRSTNTFTIDGITYNLKKNFNAANDGGNIELTITQDVTQAFENIKSFVEEYNKLIDEINSELKEERFRDYPPLTDAQKEEMSEKEIELWEEKAKSGLLRNDSILQNIVYSMRRALVEGVEGISIGLSSIGITTGSYIEGGKLHIDESKLKEALQTKGDQVMRLFSQESEISYSPDLTTEQRTQRYKESGLMQRIYDVIQDNIRTTRDKDGRKGTLLEKAGIVGDASEFSNVLYDQLKDMNERIDDAVDRMYEIEERYWRQFTALETALQQMNSQSLWLYQQLGGRMQ